MTEKLFVVIQKDEFMDSLGEIMASSVDSQKVFAKIDSAIKYVLQEAASFEVYAYNIGVRSKDISVTRMLDDNYGSCRILQIEFPDDRGHKENRAVIWKIVPAEFIED